MNWLEIIAAAAGSLSVLGIGYWYLRRKSVQPGPPAARSAELPASQLPETLEPVTPPETIETVPVRVPPSLREKLGKTRSRILGNLEGLFGRSAKQGFEPKDWDELEEGLLAADIGMATTTLLLDRVRESAKRANGASLRDLVRVECENVFTAVEKKIIGNPKPLVISIVGVNGVGKTTTIGKLASRFIKEGRSVLLGAADTFRAGAISQLKVWADRSGAQLVAGREGGDPGAVAFDALTAGVSRGMDVVILDTAGRLHTKSNLMDELKKVHRVMTKVIAEAPHETWLVLDGTLGQNSVRQAMEFGAAL
ncbi:MAG: signal recognition particle-docking protein FtsY, partial [Bdellovibrionales bacterium]|nr:signal recognition particle-docking protein FtsY [Bdellovibrionales bacterium]